MGATVTKEAAAPIAQLIQAKEAVSIQDNEFWEKVIPSTIIVPEKIFTQASQEGVRTIKQDCPKNLATLVRRAILKLQAASRTPCQIPTTKIQVTNAVRMLTKIIPNMLEDPAWDGFWWTPTPLGVVVNISGEDIQAPEAGSNQQQEPLAFSLLSAILDLLFVPGYTVEPTRAAPISAYKSAHDMPGEPFMWSTGIGHKGKFNVPSVKMATARYDLLRLLLVCISRVMYQSAQTAEPEADGWLRYLTAGTHAKASAFYLSIFNTVLSYDAFGWNMPFGSWFPDVEYQQVVEACGDLVGVLVDFRPRQNDDSDSAPVNHFANTIASISDDKDFDFVVKGMVAMMMGPLQHNRRYPVVHHALLITFWRLLDTNEKFVSYVLRSGEVLEIITPALYYIHEYRLNHGQIGLVHICVYILLILSGRRNFSVRLNKEYEPTIRIPVPTFEGNYGDLILLVIHSLLTSKNPHLTPLYECLLTIIVNISPYMKRVSLIAANKLVHLFEVFSSPRFLFAKERNHHLIFFLLESFNNLIQYQFEGNQHLVYVVIRRRQIFTRLMGIASSPLMEDEAGAATNAVPQVVFDPANTVPTTPVGQNHPAVVRSSLKKDGHDKEHFTVQAPPQQPQLPPAPAGKGKASGDSSGTPPVQESVASAATPREFLPTKKWMDGWRTKLPLETINRLLQVLVPQVEKLCADKGVTDEAEIIEFLKNGTLVGLLPVPHPILIRRHQSVPHCTVWFSSYLMGVLYLRYMEPPIWHGTQVRLFKVKHVQEE
eukprot:m.1331669 g.1331669  ORF g.1331669 m.1331669 type:complete len:768 (-) comp24866_c0_seq6:3369-5672(-)